MVVTIAAMAASVFTVVLSAIAVVTLLVFLTTRELASTDRSRFSLCISRFASVVVVPLVIALAVMVAVEIATVL